MLACSFPLLFLLFFYFDIHYTSHFTFLYSTLLYYPSPIRRNNPPKWTSSRTWPKKSSKRNSVAAAPLPNNSNNPTRANPTAVRNPTAVVVVVTAASPTAVKSHTVVRSPTAVAMEVVKATAVKNPTVVKKEDTAAAAAMVVATEVVRAMDARRADTAAVMAVVVRVMAARKEDMVVATSPVRKVDTMVNSSNSALTTVDAIWRWVLVPECCLVERRLLEGR